MDIEIEKLVPHRGKMKLLDKIITVDDQTAVTESIVTDNWPLVEKNVVNCLILIELVAQTSAICIGWKELKNGGNNAGGKGWLVGIKSAIFFTGTIPVHTNIRTQAQVSFTMDNFTEIKGESKANGQLLGKIILQVLRSPK